MNMKKRSAFLFFFSLFFLIGCEKNPIDAEIIKIGDLTFEYYGTKTWVPESNVMGDMEILATFAEKEENSESSFSDSLIVAENYDLGKWPLAFSRDTIQVLKTNGLQLENEGEDILVVACNGKRRNLIIESYQITSGFITQIPKLYMTQAFLEGEQKIYVFSHSTEEEQSQKDMIKSFKTIKCDVLL